MKNFKKKYLSPLLTILFLAVFARYFLTHLDDFRSLKDISIGLLLLVALFKFANYCINGIFMNLTTELFTRKMRLLESIYVAILSSIGTFFGPFLSGATIRAVYLKKTHGLAYSHFASTLAGYYLIFFGMSCVIALVALTQLPRSSARHGLIVFFSLWLAALLVLMVVRLPGRQRLARLDKIRPARWFFNVVYEVEEGWRRLLKARLMIPRLMLLALASYATVFFTALIEFKAIDADISIAGLALFAVISISSMLVALTPGAIGVREGLLLLTSSVMGVSNNQILQVSLIDRGVSFVTLLLLFILLKVFRASDLESGNGDSK